MGFQRLAGLVAGRLQSRGGLRSSGGFTRCGVHDDDYRRPVGASGVVHARNIFSDDARAGRECGRSFPQSLHRHHGCDVSQSSHRMGRAVADKLGERKRRRLVHQPIGRRRHQRQLRGQRRGWNLESAGARSGYGGGNFQHLHQRGAGAANERGGVGRTFRAGAGGVALRG